jgi:hypothetical protein
MATELKDANGDTVYECELENNNDLEIICCSTAIIVIGVVMIFALGYIAYLTYF